MKRLLPNNHSRGFTLIELLVVITILAILGAISISVFGNAQKNARDGKAKADINSVARSIETSRTIGNDGTVKYTYNATSLQNDYKTTPSGKNAYCLRASNTASDVADPASTWTTACPDANWIKLGDGGWPSDNSYWNVCASLEGSATPYCVSSFGTSPTSTPTPTP